MRDESSSLFLRFVGGDGCPKPSSMNDGDDNIDVPKSNESNCGVIDRCRARAGCARGGDVACGRGGEDERRSMTSGIVSMRARGQGGAYIG